MTTPESFAASLPRRLPLMIALISIAIGCVVLCGWLLDIGWLHTFTSGQVSMKANSAIGFVACGALLLVARQSTTPKRAALRFALVLLLALIGTLTVAQDVFHLSLPIDQLLVSAPADGLLTTYPGRMAPTTAICFLLFAAALLIDYWPTGVARGFSRTLATLMLLIAITSLLGYAYRAPQLYLAVEGVTAMSLPSAMLFLLLAVAVIWLHPEYGFPAMMAERSVLGAHIRALIPMVAGAPLLVGFAVSSGYGHYFEGPFAIALTSLGSIIAAGLVAVVSIIILRRAEGELYIKDRALAASTHGVLITDHRLPDEPITFVNAAFSEITGFSADAALGRNCRFLNHGIDNSPAIMAGIRHCLSSACDGTFELKNRRKDGSTFWNHLSLAPVRDYEGNATHFVGIMEDISSKREQEARLQSALADAEAANSMRNTFVRLVSHELRTPLNAALTWIRLMEVDDRPATLVKGMSIVAQSIESQSRLIDDLVDVTRFSAAGVRLESEAVDVRDLVLRTIDELRPMIEAEQMLIVEAGEHTFTALLDPLRLQQIVRNLVGNASKYTPQGGQIAIRLAIEGRHIVFSVKDSGKGLSANDIKSVFEPFWRAESHQPGLGVGLSIVAALVAAHDGTIEVTSDGVGKGSEFVVRLPADADPAGLTPLHDKSASAVVDPAD